MSKATSVRITNPSDNGKTLVVRTFDSDTAEVLSEEFVEVGDEILCDMYPGQSVEICITEKEEE